MTVDDVDLDESLDALADSLLVASRLLLAISARSIAQVDETITFPQFRTLVILFNEGPSTWRPSRSRWGYSPRRRGGWWIDWSVPV